MPKNITIRPESFKEFIKLVKDQFEYGGKKYNLSGNNQRESTDVLFDRYSAKWLLGTIDKYTFRYRNLKRERDLLKIATYMYLLWLKRGFHIMSDGIKDPPIDTTLKNKLDNFDLFIERSEQMLLDIENDQVQSIFNPTYRTFSDFFTNFYATHRVGDTNLLDYISSKLRDMANLEWYQFSEKYLIMIFYASFLEWEENYSSVKEHDTDTHNEEQGSSK